MASVGEKLGLVLTTASTVDPITTAEAKLWAHIDDDTEDALIATLISGHRRDIENRIQNRSLTTQTWTWTADSFAKIADDWGIIIVPRPPLQSITSINYIDSSGDSQTWSSSLYTVDTAQQPGRITPTFEESYPETQRVMNAVTIIFVAGYGNSATDVPDDTRNALKMLVAIDLARGDETDARKVAQMRKAAMSLLETEALPEPG